MTRFSFRLERVMDYRRLQRDLAQARLEKIIAARQLLHVKLIENQQAQASSWLSPAVGAQVSPEQLNAAGAHREALKRSAANLKIQASEIEQQIRREQLMVLEAKRKYELLEKLKTRRRNEWQYQFDQQLEEIAGDAYRSRLHATRSVIQER